MDKFVWIPRNACDVAKYVVSYANANGIRITHLKLQKILYYLQGEVAAKFKEMLFPENIEAWQYGPVVRVVYYEYCPNGALPLYETGANGLNAPKEMQELINTIIDEKLRLSESQLVRDTHREQPWLKQKDAVERGDKPIIPFEDIQAYFVEQLG